MNQSVIDAHILPRPVERLPEYAHAKARQTLAERLVDAFGLSEASASAIAAAVVDPSEVRKSIGEPTDPDVEKIPVPGGTLLGIRTSVWARRTMPDPRNPRTLPSRRHPFAIDPGTGGEDSKFRPVPEPRVLDQTQPQKAELVVDIESRHHLTWAAQQAAAFVLAENDWRTSIESQGVMEAVWLVATTYQHSDGSAPATTLTTVEGSSRDTAVHSLLGIHSADVPYDDNDARFRAHIRKLNEAFDRGERNKETVVALRCERIPALILLGFRPHASGSTGFPTAVKSLVALRHVDPPKPWGEGPENESLADEVLDELHRRDLISSTQRDYFAGSCTRSEARAAHLPEDPVLRAAQIVYLFTTKDDRVDEAIRVAVTSQSTRKRITPKLMNELATALILRAVADDPGKVDQIRRYLRHAFGKSTHRASWEATGRTTDQLVKEALTEVREAIGSGATEEPGPTSLELAVRASYPLVVSGRLNADRGSSGNDQPDRRTPGEVLDAMRRSLHGVHQLGQALRDFETGAPLRAVDESGQVKHLADGSADQMVSDIYLRNEFPPPGRARAARPGDTATDRYHNALAALGRALDGVDQAFTGLTKVVGDDDQPVVEARGVEPRLTDSWRELLSRIDEEMVVWARTFRKAYGTKTSSVTAGLDDDDDAAETDPYADVDEDAADDWSHPNSSPEADAAE
ncbi:hypothetical protein RZS28_11315 [Methylocapsa polymorpha]|uniref:Uncharacterized protein n=1 Tax=Methylocapsa polymorpha TaxID=3080828 RepID=A0ABZ0HNA0_9HYPH|nr:hypothetical protein RZS28_11315 [Methylocapsa sp. RX1]